MLHLVYSAELLYVFNSGDFQNHMSEIGNAKSKLVEISKDTQTDMKNRILRRIFRNVEEMVEIGAMLFA